MLKFLPRRNITNLIFSNVFIACAWMSGIIVAQLNGQLWKWIFPISYALLAIFSFLSGLIISPEEPCASEENNDGQV